MKRSSFGRFRLALADSWVSPPSWVGSCSSSRCPTPASLRRQNPKTTAFIELRRREAAAAGKPFRLSWSWRSLDRISPFLRRAVIHTEDAKFFKHEGVDWEAVRQTAERDWQEKSLRRGGSTITQQVAKNLYLSPSRNPVRKLRELLITWRLEENLSKERILEIYLNIAEWGPGVFGAEAAARRWYGVSAADLTARRPRASRSPCPTPSSARPPCARAPSIARRPASSERSAWPAPLRKPARPGPAGPRSSSHARSVDARTSDSLR